MKAMITWVLMGCIAGCATMSTINGSPAELQQRIAARELVRPGDHVRITTTDGNRHDLDVTSVSAYSIDGKRVSILVKDVFAIEKREPSIGGRVAVITVAALAALAIVGLEVSRGAP